MYAAKMKENTKDNRGMSHFSDCYVLTMKKREEKNYLNFSSLYSMVCKKIIARYIFSNQLFYIFLSFSPMYSLAFSSII